MDQRRQVDELTKAIQSKKLEQEAIEARFVIASEVWKTLGLEMTLVEEGKTGDTVPAIPESGDQSRKAGGQAKCVHPVDGGTYQILLTQLPISEDKCFKFKIKFEDGAFSVLEADSSLFTVPDLAKIESEAGSDCRLLICLLRRHLVSKLASH